VAPLLKELKAEADQSELQALLDRAEGLAAMAEALLGQRYPESVYWVDVDAVRGRRVTLACAPLDPGPALRTLLFERVSSVVLTSATLAVGPPPDSSAAAGETASAPFAYALQRMGTPEAETLRLGSPFDYSRQARIRVEAGMPDPASGETY